MTDSRQIDGPTSSDQTISFEPFVRPADGSISVSADVSRDGGGDSPVFVQILVNGRVIETKKVTASADPQPVEFSLDSKDLPDCVVNITVVVSAGISTACCPDPLPMYLNVDVEITGTTINQKIRNYSIPYSDVYHMWCRDIFSGSMLDCGEIFVYCYDGQFYANSSGTCDNFTGSIHTVSLVSCDPFKITFGDIGTYPPGTDVTISGSISY